MSADDVSLLVRGALASCQNPCHGLALLYAEVLMTRGLEHYFNDFMKLFN